MNIHPLCMILPAMSGSDYQGLVADIKLHGLIRPITTYQGKILDGRHRFLACKETKTAPRYEEYIGTDPASFVASSCMHRSLNEAQRALIAVGFLAYEREQAKARQALNLEHNTSKVENLPPSMDSGKSRDKAGQKMNVSGRSVSNTEKLMQSATPEVVEKIRSGDMAINEAQKIVRLNPQVQRQIVQETSKFKRLKAIQIATNRSVAAKRRSQPAVVAINPGSSFVRKFLSSLERMATICAEDGEKDAAQISARFFREMDWESDVLTIQLERGEPVIRALAIIRQHAKAA
jgi:ParB-like chromosome segregation protein Spo0J